MKITVRVKPRARKNEVLRLDETTFQVHVTDPPAEGKANEKLIELLAEFFRKPKRSIAILKGHSSRNKIVEVL